MCECLCSLKGATASAGNRQLPINADTVQFANSYLRSTGISSGVGKTITLCFFYQLIVLKLKLHETVQLKSDGKSHLVQVTINECFIRQCLGELKFKYCNSKIQGKLLHAVPPSLLISCHLSAVCYINQWIVYNVCQNGEKLKKRKQIWLTINCTQGKCLESWNNLKIPSDIYWPYEVVKANRLAVKNMKGPHWSQSLACLFWGTVETWRHNMADSSGRRPTASVEAPSKVTKHHDS